MFAEKKFTFPLIMAVVATSLMSCSTDSDSDQPQLSVQFNTVQSTLDFQSQVKEEPLKQATTASLSFYSGSITIGELEFEVETENDSTSIDFELEQVVVIDFATGSTTPDIGSISIPAGTYEEVEIEIELHEGPTGNPAIMLNGVFTDLEGTEHPVRFEFNSEESFEVEREGVITFSEDQTALAQVTFDPVLWFAEVSAEEMSAATKDENGTIVISSTQNADIFDIVADGLDLATDVEIEN